MVENITKLRPTCLGYGILFLTKEQKERFIANLKEKQHKEEVMMIRNRSYRYNNYPIFEKKYKTILLLECKSC